MDIKPEQKEQLVKALLKQGLVNKDSLKEMILKKPEECDFIDALYFYGEVEEEKLLWIFSNQFNLPLIPVVNMEDISEKVLNLFPKNLLRDFRILPFMLTENTLNVLSYRPLKEEQTDLLKEISGYRIECSLLKNSEIERLLNTLIGAEALSRTEDVPFISTYLPADSIESLKKDYTGKKVIELMLSLLENEQADFFSIDCFKSKTHISFVKDNIFKKFLTLNAAWSEVFFKKFLKIFNLKEEEFNSGSFEKNLSLKIIEKELFLNLVVNKVTNGLIFRIKRQVDTDNIKKNIVSPAVRIKLHKTAGNGGIIFLCGNRLGMNENYLFSLLNVFEDKFTRKFAIGPDLNHTSDNFIQISTKAYKDEEIIIEIEKVMKQLPEIILITRFFSETLLNFCIEKSFCGITFIINTFFSKGLDLIYYLLHSGLNKKILPHVLKLFHSRLVLPGLCQICRQPIVPDKELEEYIGSRVSHNLYVNSGCENCRQMNISERVVLEETLEINKQIKDCISLEGRNIEEALARNGFFRMHDNLVELILQGFVSADFLREFC